MPPQCTENGNNYYPFGMVMPGRLNVGITGAESYRFAYQGSEKDDEIKGSGNSYTTEFRQLDPRLARWLSVDPEAKEFPWQSPYCSMDGNPIKNFDKLGDSIIGINEDGRIDNFVEGGYSEKAFKMFFETKKGRKFVAKYAKAGQTLYGHTFEKDGKYHTKKIDLEYKASSTSGANGRTFSDVKDNGRAKFTVLLSTSINSSTPGRKLEATESNPNSTDKEIGEARLDYIVDRAKTLTHESLIHVELNTEDFLDNGELDRSNIPQSVWNDHVGYSVHHTYARHSKENSNLPLSYKTDGKEIMIEIYNKYKPKDIEKVWDVMWDFAD